MKVLPLFAGLLLPALALAGLNVTGSTCTVTPLPVTGGTEPDDTPQILQAFKQCGTNGKIVLTEGLFHIGKVMDTLSFNNVDIEIHGTLRWSSDIQYWLRNSLPVTYAGRSAAWRVGGTDIRMRGFGKALFDGQGQLWYDQNRGNSNQNGRPISLTLWHAKNVLVDGITWRQSQFWRESPFDFYFVGCLFGGPWTRIYERGWWLSSETMSKILAGCIAEGSETLVTGGALRKPL
jgi:hypothetical protein